MPEELSISAKDNYRVFEAAMALMVGDQVFEEPLPHSPSDTVCEMNRVRMPIEQSCFMNDGPFILEVAVPVNEFSKTACWLMSISFLNPKQPEGQSLGGLTISKEGMPYAHSNTPSDSGTTIEELIEDLESLSTAV